MQACHFTICFILNLIFPSVFFLPCLFDGNLIFLLHFVFPISFWVVQPTHLKSVDLIFYQFWKFSATISITTTSVPLLSPFLLGLQLHMCQTICVLHVASSLFYFSFFKICVLIWIFFIVFEFTNLFSALSNLLLTCLMNF